MYCTKQTTLFLRRSRSMAMINDHLIALRCRDRILKRTFDIVFSALGLLVSSPIMLVAFIIASLETKSNGFFVQKRIGRDGKSFQLVKIKSMKRVDGVDSTVTTRNDVRITTSGAFFRHTKIDELPQLWNVLKGDMSFVGPRPDVPGYADKLQGADRAMLILRPGITGPASLKYKDEETLLAAQADPEQYNDEVIWPDKVSINLDYIRHYSFVQDLVYILRTFRG